MLAAAGRRRRGASHPSRPAARPIRWRAAEAATTLPAIPAASELPPSTVALCVAFAREARRIALGDAANGDCLVWLLAQLTADHPQTDLPVAAARLIAALLTDNGPLLWEHGRRDPAMRRQLDDLND